MKSDLAFKFIHNENSIHFSRLIFELNQQHQQPKHNSQFKGHLSSKYKLKLFIGFSFLNEVTLGV